MKNETKTKRELAKELQMLFALMGNLPGMVYRCRNDKERTMEFVSGGSHGLTGYTFSDLFHNRRISYAGIIHPDDRESLVKGIEAAIEKKKRFEFVYRIKTASGKERWVWEQGRAIFSIDTKSLILEGFVTDITERKEMEEELRAAFDKLKTAQDQLVQSEKMGAIGRLASGVAHEVKNPLATLLQGVYYLNKKIDKKDSDITLTLQSMNNAVERADSIIKGLLDFASVSEMKRKPSRINAIIENSLSLVRNDISKKNIKVVKKLADALPLLNLDRMKIEQVFINLFTNAAHAMSNGGELTVRSYNKEDAGAKGIVIAEVEDTGVGVRREILDRIFDPFFSTRLNKGGAGLGLSIVKNIIDMHGGRIEIKNRDDRDGTRVTIAFGA